MKRCFIENDTIIDDYDVEEFKETTGKDVEQLFHPIITEAFTRQKEVWTAILESDEIWITTSFIGDSETLFTAMLKLALDNGVKNKVVINLREYSDIAWHLTPEQRDLMKTLEKKNKIKFIFKDDYKKYKSKVKKLKEDANKKV